MISVSLFAHLDIWTIQPALRFKSTEGCNQVYMTIFNETRMQAANINKLFDIVSGEYLRTTIN